MTFFSEIEKICQRVLTVINASVSSNDYATSVRIAELKKKAIKDALLYAYKKGKEAKEAELADILKSISDFEDDAVDGSKRKGNT